MYDVFMTKVFKGTYIRTFDIFDFLIGPELPFGITIVSPKAGNISFYLNSSSKYNSPFSMKQFVVFNPEILHYTLKQQFKGHKSDPSV